MTPFDMLFLALLVSIALVNLATFLVVLRRRRNARRKARAEHRDHHWVQLWPPDEP